MGADERVDEVSHARPQVELLLHLHHVDLGDRPHPGRVAAGLGQRGRAGVSEIAVVACRVATQQLLHVAVELCKVRLGLLIRMSNSAHTQSLWRLPSPGPKKRESWPVNSSIMSLASVHTLSRAKA